MTFNTIVGLARKAETKPSVLRAIAANIPGNYRVARIPKATAGEFRTLSIPKRPLMAIQRAIYVEALSRVTPSEYAHAYSSKRSIISHADIHRRNGQFIQIDIKEFFPSVGVDRVRTVFQELRFGSDVVETLVALCTLDGGLPQGAPTSPALSNAVLRGLDYEFAKFAATIGASYSRYADDLVISSNDLSVEIFEHCIATVERHGFKANLRKSRLMLNPSKVILTGISVSTGELKVPKAFKREVRSSSYKLLSRGPMSLVAGEKVDPFAVDRVIGRLLFWERVEPDAAFPKRSLPLLRERYFSKKRSI